MASQRIFLWSALALVLWLNYQAWMQDYHRPVPPPQATSSPANAAPMGGAPGFDESVPAPQSAPTPQGVTPTPATPTAGVPAAEVPAADGADNSAGTIHVRTDVLDLDISLQGGRLTRADLLQYPRHKDQPDIKVRLFNEAPSDPIFVFQSGLTADGGGAQPDHRATFAAPATDYTLANGQDELKIPLTWNNGAGLTVTKTFTFHRGNYAIHIDYAVDNQGTAPWSASSYVRFMRQQHKVERSMFNVESYAFAGPAVFDGAKYRKLKVDNDEDRNLNATVTDGWLAAMQHHFVAAVVPPAKEPYQFRLQVNGDEYLLGAVGPKQSVAPGGHGSFTETVFVGPKLQSQLEKTGPRLELVADYGKLTFIAKPLFSLLSWVHGIVRNWGLAIIIVTALIKLLFYWPSQVSGKSMAKMRALTPRIKNIQERYKDDREQLGRAMMELYKREKVNPLAGCMPILIQIPVFLAFYWVLLESVEMRQAPFMLWINDLSSRDPFFILPLIMGGAMFVQYKLNPAPPDPVQAKVFMFMPLIMTFMFAWFPAGLVLYWITNTILSITQQWNINRLVAAQDSKKN
ncbi:MAG TPA: membrane protein insertase YidC [Steroidobacteraceae bacterium]|nr:membrane protein insertase YidC [Steroidobacteraceae bacterium]